MQNVKPLLLTVFVLLMWGCSEDPSEVNEANSFFRIYDNNIFSYSFSPIDVVQTSDGGYVVLAEKFIPAVATPTVHLIKADKFGDFVRDIPLAEDLTNPLAGMAAFGGNLQFVCMDISSQGHIVSFDENLDNINVTPVAVNYPAAAAFIEGEFLILSFNQIDKKSIFSRITPQGNVAPERSFTIAYDDSMEDEVIRHFLRTGTRYPFQVGRLPSGLFYFNGFFDHTFSLVFTSLRDDDDVDGVVQGQQDQGGFSAVVPLGSGSFATAYFHYDDNYILPAVALSTSTASTIADLEGFNMPEFVPQLPIQILRAVVDGKNVLVYAASTRSKQVGLFMYDEVTGEFLGSRYFGFTNPFEFGRMSLTEDGGAVIAGTTYVAGRFSRPVLIKLSKDELAEVGRK